jgi:GT2 family glycosyltransferase
MPGSDVDVVIVAYNSERQLERCVGGLIGLEDVTVTVVDNASQDGTLTLLATLPVTTVEVGWNSGFSHGCNTGWRRGTARYVLFLNPDAAIDEASLRTLVAVLDEDPGVGIVAPRVSYDSGELSYSLRRYPSLSRAFAQAFFVHRLVPNATWADEVVRTGSSYEHGWSPEWVSGACMLVRRSVLEAIGGFDETFFLYSEDVDICRRAREAGAAVRFEPGASCVHSGGASAPSGTVLPLMARSRVLYARKHENRPVAALYAIAVALSSLTHSIAATDRERRKGYLRALTGLASPLPATRRGD